ncbi:MAG: DUF2191 domain-containing protein [Geodermatophilaceae bacterium]|nr:DUF2191 domain-containing protein [Geodermatophilaceae bacterium]
MRTTVRLDEGLFRAVKQYAATADRTVTSVLEEALRRLLAEVDRQPSIPRPVLPLSTAGGGLLPGVDLDDGAALAELMDERSSR